MRDFDDVISPRLRRALSLKVVPAAQGVPRSHLYFKTRGGCIVTRRVKDGAAGGAECARDDSR